MFFEPLTKKSPCLADGGALTIRIGESILIDIGSFISNTPKEEHKKITDIFLTHAHLDHIKDLAFFAEGIFSVFQDTINVWGTKETVKSIRKHIFNGEIWPDFIEIVVNGRPILQFKELEPKGEYRVKDFKIIPIPVNHTQGAVGFLVSNNNQHVVVTGDTGPTDEIWEFVNMLKGDTTVFVETSFPDRLFDVANKSMHLTPSNLGSELKKIKRSDVKIFVYHIKHQYYDEIVSEIGRLNDPRIAILEG